jgi:hypothetical protein
MDFLTAVVDIPRDKISLAEKENVCTECRDLTKFNKYKLCIKRV